MSKKVINEVKNGDGDIIERYYSDGSSDIAMESCWCGHKAFHISLAREVYCASCQAKIDGAVVFGNSGGVGDSIQ